MLEGVSDGCNFIKVLRETHAVNFLLPRSRSLAAPGPFPRLREFSTCGITRVGVRRRGEQWPFCSWVQVLLELSAAPPTPPSPLVSPETHIVFQEIACPPETPACLLIGDQDLGRYDELTVWRGGLSLGLGWALNPVTASR